MKTNSNLVDELEKKGYINSSSAEEIQEDINSLIEKETKNKWRKVDRILKDYKLDAGEFINSLKNRIGA